MRSKGSTAGLGAASIIACRLYSESRPRCYSHTRCYSESNSMSDQLTVTLPDGSQQTVAAGTRPLDIAKSIGNRLADDAIVARVNGDLFDLTRPLEGDASLEILTTKNREALNVYRHSTAHLLAAAVLELFPETKLGIGPPIETGFFYD